MDTENGLRVIPGPMIRYEGDVKKYKVPKITFALYYRNVPRDVVMFEIGDYATLRKLEQEIRLIDPGNYLAIHELKPVTEDKIESIIKELFE